MIAVQLREAMTDFQQRTGRRITYIRLADLSGLAADTLRAIARRPGYNPSLDTLDRICRALETTPADILAFDPRTPQPKQ